MILYSIEPCQIGVRLSLLQLHVCERVLEQEGVFGYVTIDEYPLDLIPLDKDVLSLELPEFFRSYYLVRIKCILVRASTLFCRNADRQKQTKWALFSQLFLPLPSIMFQYLFQYFIVLICTNIGVRCLCFACSGDLKPFYSADKAQYESAIQLDV